MAYSIYESISNNKSSLVNAFAVPIESSAFHWHTEYELIGVLKGSITLRVQSDTITLKEKDVLLINSNVIHAIWGVEGEENLCMVIQFSPELLTIDKSDNSDLQFYLDSTSEIIPECGFLYFYQKMAKIIYATMQDEKYAPFRARAEACCLIADLFDFVVYDTRFRDIAMQNCHELTVAMMDFFEQHLEEEKIMDITCHDFGISRKTLDRNMRMTVGLTGKEVVDNLRLEKAKNLLKKTDKNMNFILDSCGFGSEKTFYRVFQRETGMTPKAFREKGQIMNYNDALKGYLDFETPEIKAILKNEIHEYGM